MKIPPSAIHLLNLASKARRALANAPSGWLVNPMPDVLEDEACVRIRRVNGIGRIRKVETFVRLRHLA